MAPAFNEAVRVFVAEEMAKSYKNYKLLRPGSHLKNGPREEHNKAIIGLIDEINKRQTKFPDDFDSEKKENKIKELMQNYTQNKAPALPPEKQYLLDQILEHHKNWNQEQELAKKEAKIAQQAATAVAPAKKRKRPNHEKQHLVNLSIVTDGRSSEIFEKETYFPDRQQYQQQQQNVVPMNCLGQICSSSTSTAAAGLNNDDLRLTQLCNAALNFENNDFIDIEKLAYLTPQEIERVVSPNKNNLRPAKLYNNASNFNNINFIGLEQFLELSSEEFKSVVSNNLDFTGLVQFLELTSEEFKSLISNKLDFDGLQQFLELTSEDMQSVVSPKKEVEKVQTRDILDSFAKLTFLDPPGATDDFRRNKWMEQQHSIACYSAHLENVFAKRISIKRVIDNLEKFLAGYTNNKAFDCLKHTLAQNNCQPENFFAHFGAMLGVDLRPLSASFDLHHWVLEVEWHCFACNLPSNTTYSFTPDAKGIYKKNGYFATNHPDEIQRTHSLPFPHKLAYGQVEKNFAEKKREQLPYHYRYNSDADWCRRFYEELVAAGNNRVMGADASHVYFVLGEYMQEDLD